MLGYTSQTWLDDYFFYSYYLWMAVPTGKEVTVTDNRAISLFSLTTQGAERLTLPNNFPKHQIPPGVLTSDCYK